jgi:hypothetical protein
MVALPTAAARNESPPSRIASAHDKKRAVNPHNDDDQPNKEEEEGAAPSSSRRSLSSQNGTATGLFQSLSLLLNAALMVYAHMGLSAVFVSNQVNIGEAIAAAETAAASTTTPPWFGNNTACSVDDRVRWTSVIGPHVRVVLLLDAIYQSRHASLVFDRCQLHCRMFYHTLQLYRTMRGLFFDDSVLQFNRWLYCSVRECTPIQRMSRLYLAVRMCVFLFGVV